MKALTKVMTVVLMISIFGTGCESGTSGQPMEMIKRNERQWKMPHKMEMTALCSTLPQSVTIIGDSITLGASGEILQIMPDCIIDAKKSRQVEEGIEIAQNLDEQGRLGDTVIIALGTNGNFSDEVAKELLDCIGEERTVCWVTAYGTNLAWKDDVNAQIKSISEQYENIRVLDWEMAAKGHEEWFCEDGIHLNEEGQAGYAEFIAQAMNKMYLQDEIFVLK